jgi:hypothetical protein
MRNIKTYISTIWKIKSLHYRIIRIPRWQMFCMAVVAFQGLISCEKVIQLDLSNSTPRVVIQADIYDHPGPYYVKISKTVNFDQSSVYPPVTGATVKISDNFGQSEVLSELSPGTYITSDLRGIPGHTYQLNVKTGQDTYQSTSVMPYPVVPDSIYFSVSPFSGDKVTTIRFNDPPLDKNYYRFIYIVSNVQIKAIYLLSDELFQGARITYSLMSRGYDIKLENGVKVDVWLESVNENVYDYFRTSVTEGGQSASPSNPVSNISNGALGYFNACSERRISRTVGE